MNNASSGASVRPMSESTTDTVVGGVPRILVCGWSGAGNVGDELLASAVLDVLRANGAIPVVVSRDPQTTTLLHAVETVPWGPRGWPRMLSRGHKRSLRVDGVCVGPGGIIQDSSSVWSLPGHLVGPSWLRRMGKPLVGVGLGAEPLKRASSRRLLRGVLKDTTVVVRDLESAAAMAEAGIEATVGGDLVFGLDLDPLPRRNEIVVAVGPRVVPSFLRPASRHQQHDDPTLLSAAIGAVARRFEANVVLASFRGERDQKYAKLLVSRIRHDVEVLSVDLKAQVDRVRSARLVITNRYHPAVVAARSGTPAIVCSTESKIASLVDQLDCPLVAKIDDWSELSDCEPTEVGEPVIPAGFGLHHDALRQLVAAANTGLTK